jgi:hypothetical protein
MRKANPDDVKQEFADFVTERLHHFARIQSGLHGSQHEKRDISVLSETTLLAMYVAFERFLSDLFLAYMNRDFSQYQANLESRVTASASERYGSWAASRLSLSRVKHIRLDELEALLDPDSRNLTFKSANILKQRASDWIAAPYSNGIANITAADVRLIDTVHAIRDFIAHQSPSAKRAMNDALGLVDGGANCPNNHLGRGAHDVHDIGAFLKSVVANNRRVTRYANRLADIAASF